MRFSRIALLFVIYGKEAYIGYTMFYDECDLKNALIFTSHFTMYLKLLCSYTAPEAYVMIGLHFAQWFAIFFEVEEMNPIALLHIVVVCVLMTHCVRHWR